MALRLKISAAACCFLPLLPSCNGPQAGNHAPQPSGITRRQPGEGKPLKKDYVTADDTRSPHGRYGVQVPVAHLESDDLQESVNQVVDLATGKVVATLPGEWPAYDRTLNHHSVGEARWSKDESVLLWQVGGKWTADMVALAKLEGGRSKWQLDLLKTGQQSLLERTREAAPEKYAAAKIANAGNGSAYPDGFTVDVQVDGTAGETIALPLTVHVDLTSNPKGIEENPTLESYLDAIVTRDGEFVVKSFHLGPGPSSRKVSWR